MPHTAPQLLRPRSTTARVLNEELFFDLVYVFAVTQLSHYLLDHLTLTGAAQALLMWFAVWLGWQYTAWVTNWFDAAALPIRILLFALMLAALLMATALPEAFGERGIMFAACYASIQVGRTVWVLAALPAGDPLRANFRRILAWMLVSAAFWLVGGFTEDPGARLQLWAVAVAIEYVAPMFGFAFPGLGRSATADWTIDGAHLAERCQLFVIVALGESILAVGVALGHVTPWHGAAILHFAVAFASSLALWWLYFDTGSARAAHLIEDADDPGRIGAQFHATHVVLVAGIIVCAVANEVLIAHGDHHAGLREVAVALGGPGLYLLGNGLFKRVVYGRFPLSHLAGLAALAGVGVVVLAAAHGSVGTVGLGAMLVVLTVAAWESLARRRQAPVPHHA